MQLAAVTLGENGCIAATGGQVRIEELAVRSGYSRKYLSELLRREVGLSSKVLARLHRFHATLSSLRSPDPLPWSELAVAHGYYDQSHLIRDFRAFTGCSPEDFVTREAPDAMTLVVE